MSWTSKYLNPLPTPSSLYDSTHRTRDRWPLDSFFSLTKLNLNSSIQTPTKISHHLSHHILLFNSICFNSIIQHLSLIHKVLEMDGFSSYGPDPRFKTECEKMQNYAKIRVVGKVRKWMFNVYSSVGLKTNSGLRWLCRMGVLMSSRGACK